VFVPDLQSICESESHVVLLFDEEGSCFLGIGCARELIIEKPRPGILEELEEFVSGENPEWSFGWLGYDLKNEIENLHTRHENPLGHPVIAWWEPEIVIKFSDTDTEILRGKKDDPRCHDALDALKRKVGDEGGRGKLTFCLDKDEYLEAFEDVKALIAKGDVYELNLCMPLKGRADVESSWPLFTRLQHLTSAPFAAYLQCGDARIMSGSPERFLKKAGNSLLSSPIKGTVKRGANPEEDEALKKSLIESEKERAENVMIVDLVRNDLSRVAQKASVEVTELCGIHSFKTVHQMVSTIQCQLSPDKGLANILRATFPMGSMTGAPKIAAMKHIDRLELEGRGIYSGSVGYISPTGDFDFNVLIRSLFHNSSTRVLMANVGGAITSLSDGDLEYEECLLKAAAVLKAVRG
tara:strand:+ start:791 stop:2020 length:1230 start_codon:yes stop_codon:yes gene_type:complete